MKRILLFFLIYLFSITTSYANDRDVRLNQLFNELKVNKQMLQLMLHKKFGRYGVRIRQIKN